MDNMSLEQIEKELNELKKKYNISREDDEKELISPKHEEIKVKKKHDKHGNPEEEVEETSEQHGEIDDDDEEEDEPRELPERFWFNHNEMKDIKWSKPKRTPGVDYDSKFFKPDNAKLGILKIYDDGRVEKTTFPDDGGKPIVEMTDKNDPVMDKIVLTGYDKWKKEQEEKGIKVEDDDDE